MPPLGRAGYGYGSRMRTVSSRRLMMGLVGLVVTTLGLHLALQLLPFDPWIVRAARRIMNVSIEPSIPTYLATVLLTVCGALAWWVSRVHDMPWPGWRGLSALFIAAGAEEIVGTHEMLNFNMRGAFETSGFLLYPWVLVGAVVAFVVALGFVRGVMTLRGPVRRWLIAGAATFLFGSLVLESVGAYFVDIGGEASVRYILASTAEEAGEFAGTLMWMWAMFEQLRGVSDDGVTLRIT